MPRGEFSAYFLQQRTDPAFGQRHNAGDNSALPLRISGVEWPQKNAGLVGLEYLGRAFNMNRFAIMQ